jgi:hypothetical protein
VVVCVEAVVTVGGQLVNAPEDDIEEDRRDERTEVIVDASKRRTKVDRMFDTGFDVGMFVRCCIVRIGTMAVLVNHTPWH